MAQSFIIYTFLLCVLVFCGWAYQTKKYKEIYFINPFIVTIILIYTIICGLRFDVGVDYTTYLETFIDLQNNGKSIYELSQEPGWIWIMKKFAFNGLHYTLFFSLVAFIQISLIVFSIKKYPQLLAYFLFVFLCNNWFSHYQNVLRQTITISFFLVLALRCYNIKFRWYLLISMGCLFIHTTSIIMLLLYPFLRIRFDKWIHPHVFALIFVICSIIGLKLDLFTQLTQLPVFGDILIAADYASYATGNKLETGLVQSLGLGYMLKIIINVIAILSYKKYKDWDENIPNLSSIFLIYFIGSCINALSPTSLLTRPNWYLVILQIPIFSLTLKYYMNTSKRLLPYHITRKQVNGYLMIVAMLLSFYTTNVIKPEGSNMEYHFWWENAKSYNL